MSELKLLQSAADFDALLESSHRAPVLLLKHSLTCPISSSAYREVRDFLADRSSDDDPVPALIEIQRAREVSTYVAQRTGVRHESPQALLIRDGEVVWHASHYSVRKDALGRALAAVPSS